MPHEIIKAFNPFSIRHEKILRKKGHKPIVKTNATKLLVSFAEIAPELLDSKGVISK